MELKMNLLSKLFLIITFLVSFSIAHANENKALVVYFSYTGNTEFLAEHIAKKLNADIFKVTTVEPYPTDTKAKSKTEKNNNARPAINGPLPDLNNYSIIFVGYPIWNGNLPMAMYTFMDEAKINGKKIVPFCTHGKGGDYESDKFIKEVAPNSEIGTLFCLRDNDVSMDTLPKVDSWLLDYAK